MLKNYHKIMAVVLLPILCCSLSFAGDNKMPWERKKAVPTCKKLTNLCSICSDGVKRVPGGNKIAKFSDYQCAARGKAAFFTAKKAKKNCRTLSDYCAVCKGDKFIFTKTGNRIQSDLYACATSPRTTQGIVSK